MSLGLFKWSERLCFSYPSFTCAAAADGQCLVWELLAAQLSASSVLPLARIKESLGAGITRWDLVFDPEINSLLVCTNERKIRFALLLPYDAFVTLSR